MKKSFILILCLLALLSNCKAPQYKTPEKDYKTEYLQLLAKADTIKYQHKQIEVYLLNLQDSIVGLHDSIEDLLIRPLMTEEQFIILYKYGSLKKYFDLCEKNPTQWKYYKGWSSQVFNN